MSFLRLIFKDTEHESDVKNGGYQCGSKTRASSSAQCFFKFVFLVEKDTEHERDVKNGGYRCGSKTRAPSRAQCLFYVCFLKTLSTKGMSRMKGTGVVQKRVHPLVLSGFLRLCFW